ncbi:MAG: family 43 glycosylhydrolase, partial [Bryobacteraceae bacterium]
MSLNSSCLRSVTTLCLVTGTALTLRAQTTAPGPAAPVIGRSLRYLNPLPIETTSPDGLPQGLNLGDVTVIREAKNYYLFGTGGGAWISSDLVNWKYRAVEVRDGRLPVAPHVVKYNGAFYMSGNDAPLYRAADVLGPYELVGPWKDEKGGPWKGVTNGHPWTGAFDVDIFIDEDNKPYLYYPGRSTAGIFVVPLDPNDLTKFAAAPKHLFGFNPAHRWERWGEANEYLNEAWIEGPWVFKRNGTYYLEYSGSGTQWLSYMLLVFTPLRPHGAVYLCAKQSAAEKNNGRGH